MPGSLGTYILYLGTALELAFVVCSIVRKSFLRYLFLNLYLLLTVLSSFGRHFVLGAYGQTSDQYHYMYFYTDALLTVTLYIAIISLYSLVFGELRFTKYVRFGAVVLLLATACFSYAIVAQSAERLSTSFAYELSQNLYFVGLVLAYILWGAVMKLRETRTRLIHFTLSLGIYFSAYAAGYALVNLGNHYELTSYFAPVLACLLPLSWLITMLRYDENSHLATAQLVAVPR